MFPSLSQLHCLSRQSLLVLLAVQAITFSSFWLSKQLLLILFCCPANCCQFLWMSRQSLCYLHCPCNCCQFFWMYKQSLLVLLAVQAITVSSFSCPGNHCQFLQLSRQLLLVLVTAQVFVASSCGCPGYLHNSTQKPCLRYLQVLPNLFSHNSRSNVFIQNCRFTSTQQNRLDITMQYFHIPLLIQSK